MVAMLSYEMNFLPPYSLPESSFFLGSWPRPPAPICTKSLIDLAVSAASSVEIGAVSRFLISILRAGPAGGRPARDSLSSRNLLMSVTEANTAISPDGGVTSFEVNGLAGRNWSFEFGDGDVSGM